MKASDQSEKALNTEEKIKLAASKVFIRKGYAATKTRDIAEEAGINIASLHYYYRSKQKLFDLVIGEALKKFSNGMDDIFGTELPLHQKITTFVHQYIDFFKINPYIPVFIMSESQNNPEKVDKLIDNRKLLPKLKKELIALADKGIIRPIAPTHFLLNVMSLTAFPFIAKPLMSSKMDLTEADYDQILEERKAVVPEMIINYLYLEKPF
ncbi:MAG: TetR/AcrR family transcriptional regulator [Bacteroidota bacterium]